MSSRDSLTLWGEGASLALVGHPSSDGVTMKMPYRVDVLHDHFRTLVVAVISVDAYPFFWLSQP